MHEYATTKDKAEEWGVSIRWVQMLCKRGKIPGTIKFGHEWMVPSNSKLPRRNIY